MRAPTSSSGGLSGPLGRLRPEVALTALPAAAGHRARRLLDVRGAHRRPHPGRRQPRRSMSGRRRHRGMNPISGTYRYPAGRPDLDGVLEFLGDRKETDELFMVVDEELKMLARSATAAPGAGPQLGDGQARAHRVPAGGRTLAGRPRGAARDDVRADHHRQPAGERLPGDRPARGERPRLLRRRPGPPRPGRHRPGHPGLGDPHPHRRHQPRGRPAHRRRRHPGPGLPARRGGRRDLGQGGRLLAATGLERRARAHGAAPARGRRRATRPRPQGDQRAGAAQRRSVGLLAGQGGRRTGPRGRPGRRPDGC